MSAFLPPLAFRKPGTAGVEAANSLTTRSYVLCVYFPSTFTFTGTWPSFGPSLSTATPGKAATAPVAFLPSPRIAFTCRGRVACAQCIVHWRRVRGLGLGRRTTRHQSGHVEG
eukprot:scaffold2859_cov349-Pavlova_lutheri.AAC.31